MMLVTGVTQLLMAPVELERWSGARLLTAFGFGLFAVGLGMNGIATLPPGPKDAVTQGLLAPGKHL